MTHEQMFGVAFVSRRSLFCYSHFTPNLVNLVNRYLRKWAGDLNVITQRLFLLSRTFVGPVLEVDFKYCRVQFDHLTNLTGLI